MRLTYISVAGWIMVVIGLAMAWVLDKQPKSDEYMFMTMVAGGGIGIGVGLCLIDAWVGLIYWFDRKHRR